MHYTLSELIKNVDVTLQGDPATRIEGVCTIQDSKPNHITFLVNPRYKKYLATTQAAAVILSKDEAKDCPTQMIIASDPYYIYAKIAAFFAPPCTREAGIHESVVIGKHCVIDPSVSIAPRCVIGNHVTLKAGVTIQAGCVIGDFCIVGQDTCLDANVTLYDNVLIGKQVHIASGVVIGSEGFGIVKHKGTWHKVPQLGKVIIEDDVDIGANSAIDRGAIDDTIIEKGVKLDNLIQVGHNVRIGENTAIAGCVGIAGSAIIGKNCLIGGKAGINGHIHLADNTVVTGMTAVTKSITEPGVYSSGVGGLTTHLEWRKNSARVMNLNQLIERVKTLESDMVKMKHKKEKEI